MGGEDLEVKVPPDGLGFQRVDHVVVVQWIVVEQRNALRPGPFGHMAGVASGAVAPVDAGFEQLGGELRVVDQQIDVAGQFEDRVGDGGAIAGCRRSIYHG